MVTSVALKILKSRWAGWIVAAALILWFSLNPRVKTVEKVEYKTRTVVETRVVTKTDIKAGADSKTTVNPDGTLTISGPVSIGVTRSETGTERTTTEGKRIRISEPVGWVARVGASVLVPPPCKLGAMRKQVEADVRIGKLLVFDVGAGARVIFQPASYSPEFYGVSVSLTF